MKKAVAKILIVALLFVSFASCKSEDTSTKDEIKIAVLAYQLEDPFIAGIVDDIRSFAETAEPRINKKIVVQILDAKGSQNLQNKQVDQIIEFDYDVLCLNMVERTLAAGIIDKAKTAGVPIVFFNREPVAEDMMRWEKAYYVGALPQEAGEIQGRIIESAYAADPQRWDKNGDGKLQYILLEGERRHQDALIRTESVISYLMDKNVAIERIESRTLDWKRAPAEAAMTQWIDQYGDKIELVISNNDNMALGAIDAYTDKGLTKLPLIVGVDGLPEAVDAIKSGHMVGTTLNDGLLQAETILELSVELVDPGSIPDFERPTSNYMWVSHNVITIDTIDQQKP